VSPSVWGTSGSAIGRIGVIAHETGHFFGLPDLYDGNDSDGNGIAGQGIGSYELMANSWGFDGSQYYPPHMSAWSKIQLGWVTPTVITAAGTYSVRQACDYPDVYQINYKFPANEYLLIENRQKCDFDAKIAGPGLAIFHIDGSASYTQEGFPGQTGWPTNGYHYRVALLQADGGYDLEKGNNRGDAKDLFFGGGGVTSIGPSGISTGASYPNTDSYQSGVITRTGIFINNISSPGSTMTFTVGLDSISPTPTPSYKPSSKPSSKPLSKPTPKTSSKPSSQPSSKPSSKPSTSPSSKPSPMPSRKPSPKPSGTQTAPLPTPTAPLPTPTAPRPTPTAPSKPTQIRKPTKK